MKKVMLICLIAGLSFSKSVSADDTLVTSQSAVDARMSQGVVVSGPGYSSADAKGGEASAGAIIVWDYKTNSYVRYPEYRLPPVNPGHVPSFVWPPSQQPWPWNSWPHGLESMYNREWRAEDVDASLRKIFPAGPLEFLAWLLSGCQSDVGKGFSCELSLDDYTSRLDSNPVFKTIFLTANNQLQSDISKILEEYVHLGAANVPAIKKRTSDQTMRYTVKQALKYDLDLGIFVGGINPLNSASSVGPGAGWNAAGVQNNFALITSMSWGDIKTEGEPAVIMFLYRKKNGGASEEVNNLLNQLMRPVIREKEEEKIPGVSVSPDLQELYKKGEANRGLREQMENIWRYVGGI